MDGWCSETRTAYHFQGCYYLGCPCTRQYVNAVYRKPVSQLLAETHATIAYLRHFVKVVEMWEYHCEDIRKDAAVKRCLDAVFFVVILSFRQTASEMVPGPRTRGDAYLSGNRVRSKTVYLSIRSFGVRGPTRWRRLLALNHHRSQDGTAEKCGVREDHHQRGSISQRGILHGGWSAVD